MTNQRTESEYAENILLLGAGFTKNFGGLLADEMWAEIFNHQDIQAQPRIKKLMQNDFDYESVYYSVLEGLNDKENLFPPKKFKPKEIKAIKEAIKFSYDHIDEILLNNMLDNSFHEWSNCVNRLLLNFGNTEKTSFIFTLNQDLFIERFYRNPPNTNPPSRFHNARLYIPGIDKYPVWFMGEEDTPFNTIPTYEEVKQFYTLKDNEYYTLSNKDEFDSKKCNLLNEGSYFLIKLHGSYNWKSSDGSSAMVIGRGKTKHINNEPLLQHYFELFDRVLSKGNRRLLVIGYGFGDEHINSVISNAVKEHGLKIYILSPESQSHFKERLSKGCKTTETTIIWNGISGYFQCVKDVLVSHYNEPLEQKRFYKFLFGNNSIGL
jgi:hypothetical protein